MNERQKRIKRITDINEYRQRRVIHDMTPERALNISSWVEVDRGALQRLLDDINRQGAKDDE